MPLVFSRFRASASIAILAVYTLALAAGLHMALEAPDGWVLVSVACDGEKVNLWVRDGALLVYNWTHSVEKTPLVEFYKITREGLVLVLAEAKSSGAGHPYNVEEIGGRRFEFRQGWMVYEADYPIGPRLEILGESEYESMLGIASGGFVNVICKGFSEATVVVASRPST